MSAGSELLKKHHREASELIASIADGLSVVMNGGKDPRLRSLIEKTRRLERRLDTFSRLANEELDHDRRTRCADESPPNRVLQLTVGLLESQPLTSDGFCDELLERLVEAVGAERGFLLLCSPDATSAEVWKSKVLADENLSLAQYDFSRSIVGRVLATQQSLLIADAATDPEYSKHDTVRSFRLRSVLATPLMRRAQAIGILYLENNNRALAFGQSELELVELAARWAAALLYSSGLLLEVDDERKRKPGERLPIAPQRAPRDILTSDPKMRALLETALQVASSRAPVVITGETGTGKELVARAVHDASPRKNGPFVVANCAAIPDTLLEAELFGHERGAFTDAKVKRTGFFQNANAGTLFLDEVGEMTPAMQAKVLRTLDTGEVQPVGAERPFHVDVRLIAATHRDLEAAVAEGGFRQDLYYRLNVVPIHLPPLRERADDIPQLVDHFLEDFCRVENKSLKLDPAVKLWLREYAFPGNIRQLRYLIWRLVAEARGDRIGLADLPAELCGLGPDGATFSDHRDQDAQTLRRLLLPLRDLDDFDARQERLEEWLRELRAKLLIATREQEGTVEGAADKLGIDRATYYRWTK